MRSIGRLFDRQSSSVFSVISPTGGIRPADRKRGKKALSLGEREEISRGLSVKHSLRAIAQNLGHAPSTISREVRRNGGVLNYRATTSEQAAWDRALRAKECKLACYPALSHAVSAKLRRKWSSAANNVSEPSETNDAPCTFRYYGRIPDFRRRREFSSWMLQSGCRPHSMLRYFWLIYSRMWRIWNA